MISFQNGDLPEFKEWPKIPRLNRDVVVTEKIDGTNACVWISDDGEKISAQSRTRWITLQSDNAGFARWVEENREELSKLGPGYHFGEWWGKGVQKRHYNLDHKRFSLFNTARWTPENVPACCHVVPVLWQGNYKDLDLTEILGKLREGGSVASPGWSDPEGVVLFHTASGTMFKILLQGDELPKGVTTRKEREVLADLKSDPSLLERKSE